MYTILPDDGQSDRLKHVAEIYRIYYILIRAVFLNAKIEYSYITQQDGDTTVYRIIQ